MTTNLTLGTGAAMFAALAWALAFIVPFIIGRYSIFDFALIEFVISGLLGLGYLLFYPRALRSVSRRDWWVAMWLGWIGYLGYFLALTGATFYAGPVIAPAFLGTVPVVLAVAGNLRQRTVAWRALLLPLALAAAGLLLVNGSTLDAAGAAKVHSLRLGIPLSILAVGLWTCFGLLNQSALARRPQMSAGVWTALMMCGAALGMGLFLPIGWTVGVFEFPRLGLGWDAACSLFGWAMAMALLTNAGAGLAWTYASQRLPVALAAQMITLEPTFGTILGLWVRRQWPTLAEGAGMAVLLVVVVVAIRVFHGSRQLAVAPS